MTSLFHKNNSNKQLALLFIGLYLLFAFIWHFLTDAPWDDDCVGRYYNTKDAFSNPKNFISLWNRPLFTLIFSLPMQLGKHAVLFMALISASGAWALFKTSEYLKLNFSFMVIPFLLFQTFFFNISKSALAEPLAAALICYSLLFYYRKQWLYFAIAGALLPLARLELSLILIFWAFVLIKERKFAYILVLGVPVLLWSLAGTALTGDPAWLYSNTVGKENSSNRYGHKSFWHYFERFIYVVGPITFFFFFIGLTERLKRIKQDFLPVGIFVSGFLIYVIFSWKLNLGQAAGFLRHLITLSPVVSILAVYGFNYCINPLLENKKDKNAAQPKVAIESTTEEIDIEQQLENLRIQSEKEGLKPRQLRHVLHQERLRLEGLQAKQPEASKEVITTSKVKPKLSPTLYIGLFSIVLVTLSLMFFSKELKGHHSLTENNDFTNAIVITVISLLLFAISFFPKSTLNRKNVLGYIALFFSVGLMGFTLITERPEDHNSPERETMSNISDIYFSTSLSKFPTYINHSWFFWIKDIDRDANQFHPITVEDITNAPDSSVIIWENHYSQRLQGDVTFEYISKQKEFVELFRYVSSDRKFMSVIYQKLQNVSPDDKLLLLNELLAENENIPSLLVNKANVLFNSKKKYTEAIALYEKASALDSTNFDAYHNKGLVQFSLGNYNEAIASFQQAIVANPKNNVAYHNMASAYVNLQQYPIAIENYNKAISLKSDYDQSFLYRAMAYTNMNKYEKAINDYTRITEIPNSALKGEAYLRRGLIQMQKQKADFACKDFQKSLQNGYAAAQNYLAQYCK